MVVRTSFFTLAVVITLSAATSRSHGIAAFKSPSESSRVLRQAETAEGDHETMSASEMCSGGDALFPCGDGDGLICLEEVCDGIDDCPDGSDEHDCESMGDSRCAGDSSACADGVGVTCDDQLCDGREDCLDGSDELNCGPEPEQKCFSEYSFTCTDGEGDVCLEFMCDGKEDCNDGSDELGCDGGQTTPVLAPTPGAARPTPTPKSPAPTLATEASIPNPGAPQAPCVGNASFACTGGSEVCVEQVCDGTHDCEDGADEQNCDPPTPRRPSYASGDPTSSSSSPASGTPTLSTPSVMNDLIHQTQSVASKVDTTASPLISIASTVPSPPSVPGAITSPSFFTASGASMLMSPPPLASDDSSLDISSSSGVSTASSSPSASVIPTSLKLYVFEDHISSIRSMASGASTTSTVTKSPSGFGDLSSPSSFTAADASISKSPTSLDDQKESFPEPPSYDSNIEISHTSAVPTTSRSSTNASVLLSPSPSLGVHAKSMPPLVSDDPYLENLEIAVDSMPGASTTFSTSEMLSFLLGSGIFSQQSTSPASNTPTPQALSIASSVSTESTSFISDVFPLLNTPIASDAHTPTNPSSLSDDKSPPTSPSASSVSPLNTFHIKAISSTTPGPFPFTASGAYTPPMSYPASSFSRDITTKSLSPYITNPTSENESNTSTNTSSTPPASNIGGYTTPRPQLATENINSLLRNHGFDGSTAPIKPNAFDSFTFHISPTLSGFATHSSALTTSGASSSSITSFISSALILEKSHTVSGASNLPTHATADGANSFSSYPGLDGPTTLYTYPAFDPSIAPKTSLMAKLSAPSNVFTTTGAQTLSIQSSVYNASTSSSLSSGSEGHYTSNSPQSPGSHTPVTSIDIPDEFDYFFTPYQSRDLHVPTPGSSLYSLNIQNPPNFVNSEASILQSSPVKLNASTLPSSHHVSVVSSVTSFPPVSKASTLSYPSASGAPSTSTSPVSFTPTMRSFSLSTLSSRIPFSSNFTHPTSSRTSVVEKSTEQSIVLNINTTTTLSPASNLSAASIAFTSENVPTQPDVATLQNSSRASDDHTLPNQLIASYDRSPPNQPLVSDDHTPSNQPLVLDDHTPPNQTLASDDHTPPNQPLASDDHTPPNQPLASDDHTPPNQPLASDDHTPPNQPLASDDHTRPNQPPGSNDHTPSNPPPGSNDHTPPNPPPGSNDHTPPNPPPASNDHTPPNPPLAPDNHASPKQPFASGNRNIAILSPARNIPPWSLWSPPSRRRLGHNSVKSATNMASSHTARGIVCALTTTLLASGVLIVLY